MEVASKPKRNAVDTMVALPTTYFALAEDVSLISLTAIATMEAFPALMELARILPINALFLLVSSNPLNSTKKSMLPSKLTLTSPLPMVKSLPPSLFQVELFKLKEVHLQPS
jgi:hypothetical protein